MVSRFGSWWKRQGAVAKTGLGVGALVLLAGLAYGLILVTYILTRTDSENALSAGRYLSSLLT